MTASKGMANELGIFGMFKLVLKGDRRMWMCFKMLSNYYSC